MDVRKVLYINQEIFPYLPESYSSVLANKLPQGIQESGFEVRTFMPKYGCINERRNQLHEVIRLSGMNLIIDDTDHPLIIKVATLQPARMQVYFIYNDDYFQHGSTKVLETISSPSDNDERSIFFVRGSLETVKKLRWIPDIVHCQGWISALAPVYLKHVYNDDPTFQNVKIVYSLLNDELAEAMDARLIEKMEADGIPSDVLKSIKDKQADHFELAKLAIDSSDGIVNASPDVDPRIIEYAKASGKPFLDYPGEENFVEVYSEFYKNL